MKKEENKLFKMENLSTIELKHEPKKSELATCARKSALMTTFTLVKANFLVWVDPVTIHGLPNIFRSKNIIPKIIWIVSTVAATVLCAYILAQSIIDYLSYEVVTKIDLIEETNAIVPQITICSSHLFMTSSSFGKLLVKYIT